MTERLPILLSREQQCELRDYLIANAARGPQRRVLLQHLFTLWLQPTPPMHISVKDILKTCPTFTDDRAVRSDMSRLKEDLRQFFKHRGRLYPFRLSIDAGYQPRYDHNDAALGSGLIWKFWRPYIGRSVRIVYPEPIFFRDARDTYIRMPDVSSADALEQLSYLNYARPLKENCSFVPSGIVEGMLFLLEAFQKIGVRFSSTVVSSELLPDGDEPMIVLGTPSTARIVTTLEASTDARTTNEGISVSSKKGHRLRFADSTKREDLTGTKYALLTRRKAGQHLVTILSAAHGRTVQALARFLTQDNDLSLLEQYFDKSDDFPTQLQAVFEVKMVETDRDPHIDSIRPRSLLSAG
jgi:hypothetical protein